MGALSSRRLRNEFSDHTFSKAAEPNAGKGGKFMSRISMRGGARQLLRAAVFSTALAASSLPLGALAGEDPDEAELRKYYNKVDVWHAHVDYKVDYNNQDVIVTRELSPQPPIPEKLCYIRFDLLEGTGDYAYGFKPAALGGPRKETEWGVYVHKRGNVLNQLRSSLSLNVIYFYVGEPKGEYAKLPLDICAQKQAANTPQAGHGYNASEWSDLVTKGKLIHGWPAASPR
jgi:hypothetical protein